MSNTISILSVRNGACMLTCMLTHRFEMQRTDDGSIRGTIKKATAKKKVGPFLIY